MICDKYSVKSIRPFHFNFELFCWIKSQRRDPVFYKTVLKLPKSQSTAGRLSVAELTNVIPLYFSPYSPQNNQREPGGQLPGTFLKHCQHCLAYFRLSLQPPAPHIPSNPYPHLSDCSLILFVESDVLYLPNSCLTTWTTVTHTHICTNASLESLLTKGQRLISQHGAGRACLLAYMLAAFSAWNHMRNIFKFSEWEEYLS